MSRRDEILGVGFDFGGTLAPRLSPLLSRLWREEFTRRLGAEAARVTHEEFERAQALYWEDPDDIPHASARLASGAVTGALRRSPEVSAQLGAQIDTAVRERFVSEVPAQQGAAELLNWLSSQQFDIGVLSNFIFPTSTVKDWLSSRGLAGYISAVCSSTEIGTAKPSPHAFQFLLKALGLARSSQLVYIGNDWVEDIEGALAAGCRAIYVAGSDPSGNPATDRIEVPEVRSLLEVRDVIQSMR
jgi:FMN phosphatase YigB (HAD superfamily)